MREKRRRGVSALQNISLFLLSVFLSHFPKSCRYIMTLVIESEMLIPGVNSTIDLIVSLVIRYYLCFTQV